MYPLRTFSLRMPVGTVGQLTPAWDAVAIQRVGISEHPPQDGETLVYNQQDNIWVSQLPSKIAVEPTLDTTLSAVVYDNVTQTFKIIPNTLSFAEDLYVHLSDVSQTIQGDIAIAGNLNVEQQLESSIYFAKTDPTIPTYTFKNFPTSGIRLSELTPTNSALSILVNNTRKMYMDNSNCVLQGNLRLSQDGTQTDPIIRFDSDPDTGIFRSAENTLGLTAGGQRRLAIGTNIQTDVPLRINGSIGTNITYMRRVQSSAEITLNGNTSGSVVMPIGTTLPSTAYDVYLASEIVSGANHITASFSAKTTTQFTCLYHNAGSSQSTFIIHAYIIGY